MDAIERVEISLRAVIAHQMGEINPLAYCDEFYIQPAKLSHFQIYQDKLTNKIQNSKDDFIIWHLQNNQPIPFWVIVEIWDFGMLSKYFSMLKQNYQRKIADRFGVDNVNVMTNWLNEINIIRNYCADHSRV